MSVLADSARPTPHELGCEQAEYADLLRQFDQPGVCVVCLDPSLTVQQANREFFRQFDDASAGVCGRRFCDLVLPSVRQTLRRQFTGLLDGSRHRFAAHTMLVGPQGSAFNSVLTAVAVREGRSHVASILVLLRPIAGGESDMVPERTKQFTEIEARILEGIAAGVSTVPLAARLYLSRQGVEYHVTRLLRKLRVPNRAALVSRAYSMGVLNVGSWPPKVVEDYLK
ncbi:helix-turn-helix transcriptional regulator [Streptomyces coffeae]|uniref:PAS domain-containing protein n=1 Tax=Streptomyces coffeae TaxID=621382 RepID=A0ABS1N6A9_9ACTN|nr:PAS domain-containing protein [Streptomyces coffeae]